MIESNVHEPQEENRLRRDRLAFSRSFVYPTQLQDLVSLHEGPQSQRFQRVLNKYEACLKQINLWDPLTQGSFKAGATQFRLLHSPFEHLLLLFAQEEILTAQSRDFILAELGRLVEAASQNRYKDHGSSNSYGIYEMNRVSPLLNIFPDPGTFRKLNKTDSRYQAYRDLIEGAFKYIQDWDPVLAAEIHLFVHHYALGAECRNGEVSASIDFEPGHIRVCPALFLDQSEFPYGEGSEIEKVLMAAQMIHEGRHQKTFYYNRISASKLDFMCTGFIHDDYVNKPLQDILQNYTFIDLFDVMLSVSYELFFLKFSIQKGWISSVYKSVIEKRIHRKKTYVYSALTCGEQNPQVRTALGDQVWQEMVEFLKAI